MTTVPPPVTKLQLTLHASKLPTRGAVRRAPDAFAKVAIVPDRFDNSTPLNLGVTEVVRSTNPAWTKVFMIEYEFGTQLNLFVDVCKGEKSIGGAMFEVGDILGSRNKTKAKRLRKGGCVYAHLEQSNCDGESSDDVIAFQLSALELMHTSSIGNLLTSPPDTFFEVSRQRQTPSGMTWAVVYRSQVVNGSLKPTWDRAEVDLETFCNNDLNRSILVSVFVWKKSGQHRAFGNFETDVQSLLDLARQEENTYVLRRADERRKTSKEAGRIAVLEGVVVSAGVKIKRQASEESSANGSHAPEEVNGFQGIAATTGLDDESQHTVNLAALQHDPSSMATVLQTHKARPTFNDYVNAGCDIDFCVAIDFTSSNGDPRIPGTLHFNNDGTLNDYEETILSIGNAICNYSKTNEFPVWGFGAKYGGQVRHIFQCGRTSAAQDVDGILDAYNCVFKTDLTMSGPTVLLQVIRAAAARARRFHQNLSQMRYCVLLILTDGIVSDVDATKNQLLGVRDLPLSVIIVGIGRADFTEMHQLSDTSSVTFVEFRPHQHDPQSLSRAALHNIPNQIVDYFMKYGVMPAKKQIHQRHGSTVTIDSAISELTMDP